MMRYGKPKLMLRACAALLLLAWVAASGFCSLELGIGHAEDAAPPHSHDSSQHHGDDAAADPHDSDKDGDHSDACCTSLKAAPQFVSSAVFSKPDFGNALSLTFLWIARQLTLVQPEAAALRQPRAPERVFTPEVYLGPALHSLAPPLAS